jgi:hypothetical protein
MFAGCSCDLPPDTTFQVKAEVKANEFVEFLSETNIGESLFLFGVDKHCSRRRTKRFILRAALDAGTGPSYLDLKWRI